MRNGKYYDIWRYLKLLTFSYLINNIKSNMIYLYLLSTVMDYGCFVDYIVAKKQVKV